MKSKRTLLAKLIGAVGLWGCVTTQVFALSSVNVNRDSAEDIADTLKGVGVRRAELIVAYREAHGPFQSIEQLKEVKGIGTSVLEKNREKITLD